MNRGQFHSLVLRALSPLSRLSLLKSRIFLIVCNPICHVLTYWGSSQRPWAMSNRHFPLADSEFGVFNESLWSILILFFTSEKDREGSAFIFFLKESGFLSTTGQRGCSCSTVCFWRYALGDAGLSLDPLLHCIGRHVVFVPVPYDRIWDQAMIPPAMLFVFRITLALWGLLWVPDLYFLLTWRVTIGIFTETAESFSNMPILT